MEDGMLLLVAKVIKKTLAKPAQPHRIYNKRRRTVFHLL